MTYRSLKECLIDLEKNHHLTRIKDEVDPHLEMSAIHCETYKKGGKALFFENVKGSPFPAVSNLFGSKERWRFIFRNELELVKKTITLKANPGQFLKEILSDFFHSPFTYLKLPFAGITALPKKTAPHKAPVTWKKTTLAQLPQIKNWSLDGGPFITLPQVFTKDPEHNSIFKSNLGMYRIQLAGNEYLPDREVGMHYQIHRGIGIHHEKALERGEDLPVSIFVGGPPAHTLSAVMPLPENMSELIFAGLLAGRRFRYCVVGEHVLSNDADFCITGWVRGNTVKPEGPFGDHLGYYSLTHDFPVMEVVDVYHRQDAIWPFTVVGRPPQEDSSFGALIHEITKPMVPHELPGIKQLHAVDEAGVHPLLLAIGSERYTPYQETKPAEILTQAHAILGFNQCSLAKYLIIVAKNDNPRLDCQHIERFFSHLLQRVDWTKNLHFQTQTTIDTLDYSSGELNFGSKVIIAAAGKKKRSLADKLPKGFSLPDGFTHPLFIAHGMLAIKSPTFSSYEEAQTELSFLCRHLECFDLESIPLVILCDDSSFCCQSFANFLWVTFTRSNPSHDIYGVHSFIQFKHWGCRGPLIIDARIKPHHAPPLEP